MLSLLLATLLLQSSAEAPPPAAPTPAAESEPPLVPGQPEVPESSATHDGQLIVAKPAETTIKPPPANGFEGVICDKPSPCVAGEARALIGPADSNFGGGGMGLDLGTEIFDASEALLQSHVRLSLVGHVNGLGLGAAGASGSPPRGELVGSGDVGLGVMSRAAFHGGFSPFAFLHPIALEISSLGGGAVWAYQPQAEVGFLAHSKQHGSGVRLSLRGGADLFYGNGPLTLLADPGVSTAQSHYRIDPLIAGGLIYDQRFSQTFGLHLGGELWDIDDQLGAAGTRQLLRGQFWIFLRIAGLITGPELTFFSVGEALSGASYHPALPETNVSWMFGI